MKKLNIHIMLLNLFIFILSLPMLDRKLHIFPQVVSSEKRELAPRPDYRNLRSAPELIHAFDSYWTDNFGGRSNMITLQSQMWVKLFQESPIPTVIIGKDGWSFYKSEGKNDGPGINDYQGLVTFKENDLDNIIKNLSATNAKLESRGIKLIVLVAPNKSTIYGEMLPINYRRFSPTTRLDTFIKAVPEDIRLVDVRDILRDKKGVMETYQKTDSHWSSFGAFIATQNIKNNYPDISPVDQLELTDYNLLQENVSGEGDLVSMMSARGIFQDVSQIFTHKKDQGIKSGNFQFLDFKYSGYNLTQRDQSLPTLLFTGDSFASYMNPFLISYFSSVYVTGFKSTGMFEDEMLDIIQPDIVIWQVAERYLDRLATPN